MKRLACLAALLLCGAALPASDHEFLRYPLVVSTSAADVPAFAWVVRQGETSMLMTARAPDFRRIRVAERGDADGQPITEAAISPDGRWIAYQTAEPYGGERTYNPANLVDPPKPLLWLVEAIAGATPRPLGPGIGAEFAPGGRLYWRHDRDLWSAVPGDAGAPAVAVKGGASFRGVEWLPDGSGFLFTQDRGGYAFLGRHRLGAPAVEWLVAGPDRIAAPKLSPDGRRVAFLRFPGREHDRTYDMTEAEPVSVERLDLATGRAATLWESREDVAGAGNEDADSVLRWVGNDRIVFRAEADGWARLHAVPAGGGAARPITPSGCEVAESEPAGGDLLLVIHNCRDLDTRQLSIVDARSGRERRLASDDLVMSAAVAAGDGRHLALVGSDADASPLLRILDLPSGRALMAERPADHGWRHRFDAPPPRAVRYRAPDGTEVPAQLFLPRGPGPHPALVYVHGGPQRQMFPAFHFRDYYAGDYAMNRRFAELGYVVLSVNYRSGVGYGRAFREAPGRGWRAASEYQDVVAAAQWLTARPEVDPGKIGIWGGSYGGLLAAQALARNSDLFKAGVAIHGVFDWSWPSAKEGHLNPSRFFGVGETDKATARASSPIAYLNGWRSPVLLFSGDQDMNVDVLETVDLAQKLRRRGVDTRTVILPGEAHGFIKHESWVRLWDEQSRFFAETLPVR